MEGKCQFKKKKIAVIWSDVLYSIYQIVSNYGGFLLHLQSLKLYSSHVLQKKNKRYFHFKKKEKGVEIISKDIIDPPLIRTKLSINIVVILTPDTLCFCHLHFSDILCVSLFLFNLLLLKINIDICISPLKRLLYTLTSLCVLYLSNSIMLLLSTLNSKLLQSSVLLFFAKDKKLYQNI